MNDMGWKRWVLDVTHWSADRPPVFVPIEDDDTIVWGMNVIAAECPGELVAVVHEGGQEEAERFYAEHLDVLEALCRGKT